MSKIRIATLGLPSDYRSSLLPHLIESMGYAITWTAPSDSDLLILGSFVDPNPKRLRWCPKPLRPLVAPVNDLINQSIGRRGHAPLRLFQTAENVRHDYWQADYSISFDLAIESNHHFRLPYWIEMIDWSHEGVVGHRNPRYGELLNLDRLTEPLGKAYQGRNWEALFLSSHLREPRSTLLKAMQQRVAVQCRGPYFEPAIKNHHESGFLKKDLLSQFALNLCPENGLYPGYYTEKIPEAFYSNCLPVSWVDSNVSVDFNPRAFINLAPMMGSNFQELDATLAEARRSDRYAGEALLKHRPSIEPLRAFMRKVLADALS